MSHFTSSPRESTSLIASLCLATSFLFISSPLYGSGYQLSERSASGLGRAFSGESVIGDDATILGSNPAGMSLLDDHAYAFGLTGIFPSIDVSGDTPFGPVKDRDVISDAVIPYLYYTTKINEDLSLGFGSHTSFGLESEYSNTFANSAVVEHSSLLSFNLNTSLSYQLNEQWTVGAGFNALYADGEISSRFPGVGSQLFQLKGDDWGYGYNIGFLYELSPITRFGLHYRSSIDLSLKGSAEVGANPWSFAPGTYDAGLNIELPDSFELSFYHELDERWALHADILWTNWSKFKDFNPIVDPAIDPFLATRENWNDTFRFAVGATYQCHEALTLRAGIAYEETPVETPYRTLRIPDTDRLWLSVGASYRVSDCYTIDVGYTHIFSSSMNINRKPEGNEDTFQGKASGDADLFSIGISGRF